MTKLRPPLASLTIGLPHLCEIQDAPLEQSENFEKRIPQMFVLINIERMHDEMHTRPTGTKSFMCGDRSLPLQLS